VSAYPEALSGADLCYIEGHCWDGGICPRCLAQLRCLCGQFIRDDGWEKHAPHCPAMRSATEIYGSPPTQEGQPGLAGDASV
jgi:hypothetical protein